MTRQSTLKFPNIVNEFTGKCQLSTSVSSINECLRAALLTNVGELLGDPSYGSYLRQIVFQYNNASTNEDIRDEIIRVANKYENRISISPEDILIGNGDDDVKILITYYIIREGIAGALNISILKGGAQA